MTYPETIAASINIRTGQANAAIELLESGNTIPFIARYRKEVTGGLDEEQLRQVAALLEKLKSLDERRTTIINSIEEQGKMTPELMEQLQQADSLTTLEDLYLPYKPKRKTRASVAREHGLQPLADMILQQVRTRQSLDDLARPFLTEDVPLLEDAWAGARDIVAETISENAEVRRQTREKALKWGILLCEKITDAPDERMVYQLYYAFEQRVDRLRPHQVLAINRGETEKILRVHVLVSERDWQAGIYSTFRSDRISHLAEQLSLAAADAAERLLLPAIERDVRRSLTETAETHAILVFADNLRALLTQPPLAGQTVLGIDPGFRTGSKVAVIDPTGRLLDTATIYPHEPQKQYSAALKELMRLVKQYSVTLIAIGNGTASRETETLVAELIHEAGDQLKYIIANEAGASVYSASPLARKEFPHLDVSIRGAVSIARRIQDPLAELVKIDPKSIGIGLYQHDVDQNQLSQSLSGVVESVVNQVGVEVSTASPALLTYVAGIGPKLAEKIVEYRDQNGPFPSRTDLRKVSGLGPKAFEQSAGFLRIRQGSNPLDASAIHPESYSIAEKIMRLADVTMEMPPQLRKANLDGLTARKPMEQLAGELGCGLPTLKDILDQLVRPGRDPRQDAPLPILRSDVLKMEDLAPGMRLKGTIRNVVDFGAFIDIGVKQDGLLHRSQIPQGTSIQVGDILDIEVLKVEIERGRISLGWITK